jgi:cytoskeleton protein RodZ
MTAKEKKNLSTSEQHVVGSNLQRVRLEKSLTLEDVNQATRISLANLRAIESMRYERLPADTFTRGQITLYGNFLGLDGRQIAKQFIIERDSGKETGSFRKKRLGTHPLTAKQLAEPTHMSSATIAGILLLLIVLSITGFCMYTSWNPFAFLTNQTKNLSSSVLNTFHPANPATGGNRANLKNLNLTALFLKDSQITISLDNKESIKKIYTKGTSAHWKAEKKIHLEFSQPDSAELRLNNISLPFPQGVDGHYILLIPAATSTP